MISWGPLDDRGVPAGHSLRPFEIAPRDAADLARSGGAIVVDCRTQEERDAVPMPDSIHIPLDQIEDRIEKIRPTAGQEVLTICHHGRRSVTATMKLRARGIPSVRSIMGGIDLWALAVDPGIPRYVRDEDGCHVVQD